MNPLARENTSRHGSSATIQYQPSPGIDHARKPRCKPNYRTRGDVLRQNSTFFIGLFFPDIDRVRRNRGKLTTYSREEAPHSGDGRKPQRAHVPWASLLSPSPAPQSAPKYYSPNLLSQSNPKCFTQVTKYSGTGSRPRKDLDKPFSWHGYTFIFLDFFFLML
ncbi:hypothetical protein Bpfe_004556 [Biomphalaria pfeifferi]|uniref:Uncharacterized protein n=1 Tax=Biomphalaria pfeifferi TaxID=112525 RepID=A0AAD8C3C2_BIOPF|nr:hypothetical protein Bpfe_004556 [Biomphalaria pfeifferi]